MIKISSLIQQNTALRTGRGRKGSSTVFLAMAFVTFAICIAASIGIARRLTVMSECQSFGRIWAKAILSEYDRHLLEDYKLMAYWGNEIEVNRKLDSYMDYSVAGRLAARIGASASDLSGYELGDPDNFSKALNKGFAGTAASALLSGGSRHERQGSSPDAEGESSDTGETGKSGRVIGNKVVLDTLPSGGIGSSMGTDPLIEKAKSAGDEDGVRSAAAGAGIEMLFMWQYFNSCMTVADDKPHYFNNELEYVIKGKPDDNANYEACRNRIFLMRNALNLAALHKDPAKIELITTVSQLITPGPLGAATQLLLTEAWAAIETEKDLEVLYDNGRVPVLKNPDQWMTDLDSVLDSSEVRKKLDDESRELLDQKSDEIKGIGGISSAGKVLTEGLTYDDHLLLMILCMNRNTRLLRIMDIVQINMKYRYYRDFNLMEYYTGVRLALTADSRSYVFEDSYR